MEKLKIIFVVLFIQLIILVGVVRPIESKIDALTNAIHVNTNMIYENTNIIQDNTDRIIINEEKIQNITETHVNCVLFVIFEKQNEYTAEDLYSDDHVFDNFYGRLYIPDIGVNVALYYDISQSVTDREDSANIYTHINYSGENIADHNHQEFGKLFGATVGTKGYIELANGEIINIECVDVLDGHNAGPEIVDENGIVAMGRNDYLMYTCRDCWQNVRIWLWDKY